MITLIESLSLINICNHVLLPHVLTLNDDEDFPIRKINYTIYEPINYMHTFNEFFCT